MAKHDITHDTAGRINVEPGDNTVTLRLFQWGIKPEAMLTLDECEKLISKVQAAMVKARRTHAPHKAATAPDVGEDYDYV